MDICEVGVTGGWERWGWVGGVAVGIGAMMFVGGSGIGGGDIVTESSTPSSTTAKLLLLCCLLKLRLKVELLGDPPPVDPLGCNHSCS